LKEDEGKAIEWHDDPYFSQIEAFVEDVQVHASDGQVSEKVGERASLSSFEDAVKTYEFTWAIREASERKQTRTDGRNS
jgi:hypothetical protein